MDCRVNPAMTTWNGVAGRNPRGRNDSRHEILRTMEYGPAPEANEQSLAWLEKHAGRFAHFIGGRFVPPAEGEYFGVVNPARGNRLAECAQGGAKDVDAAVAAARKAFKSWSALSGDERARHLYAIARILQKRERFFSVLETMDNGKPIRESRDIDIPLVVRHFYHHAGWAELIESEFPGFAPVGVCGQIIPWNFPLLMLAWKVAPALAAGNTVVLKPAEYTPLTALAFAELCQEAGLPPGVVNIVTGDGATGALIVEHPDIDKIAFTGSTEVGRIIRKATAGTGKKLSLELGGKSPFIVFDDADLDSAVEGVVDAIWFNQGQVCCAGSRLIVQEAVAERLHAKLRARMETLRVGDPLDKSTDIGAIVADVQLERIRPPGGAGAGAKAAPAGSRKARCPTGGLFYPPTLVTGLAPASILAQEEIFGPVLVSMTFRTPDEALALANNSRYGLAASVWSENINVTLDAAARVKAGVVWVNCTNLFDAASGFGGYRESGFGREGGREGLYEYLVPAWEKGRKAGDVRPRRLHRGARRGRRARGGDARHRPHRKALYRRQAGAPRFRLQLYRPRRQGRAGRAGGARQPQGRPQRRRGGGRRRADGAPPRRTIARRCSTTSPRTSRRASAEFEARLRSMAGVSAKVAAAEVASAVRRIFYYAAQADKFDGQVHSTRSRHVTLAMNEPWGVMGVLCPHEAPLLAFVSLVMPAIAMGNRVVVVPFARRSAGGHRLLPGARHERRAGRRRQHRHRRARRAGEDDRRARRRGLRLVFRLGGGERDGRARLGRQFEGDVGQSREAGALGRPGRRAGQGLSPPRDAGEEHLGALRGVGGGCRSVVRASRLRFAEHLSMREIEGSASRTCFRRSNPSELTEPPFWHPQTPSC